MKISDDGKDLIMSFEGLRLDAYQDVAGIWTIGYGSTKYQDGKNIKQGDRLKDQAQASILFLNTLAPYELAVNHGVKVVLRQHQYDALVSFTYNLGTGVMCGTTLVRKLNAGDIVGAADEFLVWNKITDPITTKKIVCKTLTQRRKKERQLFMQL